MQKIQILFGFKINTFMNPIHPFWAVQGHKFKSIWPRQAPCQSPSYMSWWPTSCCWASCSWQICPSTSCIMQSRGQPRLSSSYRKTQSCEQLLTWDPTAVKDSHTLPNSRRGNTHTARLARLGQLRPRLSKETRVPGGWIWTLPVAEQLPPSSDEGAARLWSSCTSQDAQEENDYTSKEQVNEFSPGLKDQLSHIKTE